MDTANNPTENDPLEEGHDYLWDGTGEPDPEIQKLESLLKEFRFDVPAPLFAEAASTRRWTALARRLFRPLPLLATAACVAIAIAVVTFLVHRSKPAPVAALGWGVSGLAGTPHVGPETIGIKQSRMGVGQVLETDDHSRARLQADDVGQIDIDPGTRLRLLTVGTSLKRFALDRGTIHAFIWAPPGQFVVDMPSAMAVDLGCSYTLHLDDSGSGLVRTSLGWVGFKLDGRESFIPAGAACATRPKVGPGTPYFEDASPEFRSALARLDFDDITPRQRTADLETILATSRTRDALTLWHLLARVDQAQRFRVYDRLAQLAPPPATVTKEGILRLDRPMLDLWWNALGFDDISVWRRWEHSWSATEASARP